MLDSKKDNKEHKALDLTNITNADPKYLCEDCGIYLVSYPAAQHTMPYAIGPVYLCPQCHAVSNVAAGNMLHADDIQPIDLNPFSFDIVPESKDYAELHEFYHSDGDPEPQEEEILKAKGATIIDKRVIVRRDF